MFEKADKDRLNEQVSGLKQQLLTSQFGSSEVQEKKKLSDKVYPDKKLTYDVDMAIQCRQTISEKNSFFEDLSRSEPQAEFFDEEKDDCYQRYKPDMKGAKGLNWIFIVIIIFMALSMGATAAQYHQLHRRYIKEEEKLNKAESEQGH